MTRALHPVTCKAALFNKDISKVLLIEIMKDSFSLPGGHIDAGESPDQAMARELSEELGLQGVELTRCHFLQHERGKIVLGYTGVLPEDTNMTIDPREVSSCDWVVVEDILTKKRTVNSYDEIIIAGLSYLTNGS